MNTNTEGDTMTNTNMLQGIRCPECGNEDAFLMSVAVFGRARVTDDGFDYSDLKHTESEFNTDLPVTCTECDYTDGWEAFAEGDDK